MITFTFLSNDHPEFDQEFFSNVLPKIIQDEHKEVADISIIFSNDDYLLTINQQYLNHDY